MHTSCTRPHPPFLFGAVVFAAVALLLGRGVLPLQDSPAFSLESTDGVRILLGSGFPNPGVHQFSDGMTIRGVIELTGVAATEPGALTETIDDAGIVDGMALAIDVPGQFQAAVEQGWMPARQRLALGILLHPDRMSRDDWVTLPGIGEKLAAQIESDRQNYGDFGRFEALERVKGIGPAKLKALRPFFVDEDN
ncbi:MAG: helix-hairpin-helix domain-containing protein [Desulfuromonadales bacterium]|nr:helix-hairpin-helix domain-containing protein [Desulfuromonadales bacterium]